MEIRTDLAIEAGEVLGKDNLPEGVSVESVSGENISITTINISDENAGNILKKKTGKYITIELNLEELNTLEVNNEIAEAICKELTGFIKEKAGNPLIMIIGLGNRYITPDALGPKVVEKIIVTRHIEKKNNLADIDSRLGNICAIAPGVMGVTGIETGEIVTGLVNKVKPDMIIAIDALAARKTSRINRTIQISDTGIVPGSGIGNRQMELSFETLNIPVIALGVPTVVDTLTLAMDVLELAGENKLNKEIENKMGATCGFESFVTPKNIDISVDRMAGAISCGINMAIHKGFDFNDVNDYLL